MYMYGRLEDLITGFNDRDTKCGYLFEEAVEEFVKKYKNITCKKANRTQDTKEGTDFFIDGLRFDFTLNFQGKNYCHKVGEWNNLLIGIRTGNGHRTFKERVAVVGVNMDAGYAAQYFIPRLSEYFKDFNKFLDYVSDRYWDWEDSHS